MDFNDTPEEAKFRKEAHEWLKANAPSVSYTHLTLPTILLV